MDYSEKPLQLPANIQSFFDSDQPRLEMEKACLLYALDEEAMERVSGPTGDIFLNKARLSDFPNIISSNIHLPVGTTFGLSFEINKRIFNRFPDYFTDAFSLMEQWARMKTPPVISEDEASRKLMEIEPWLAEQDKRQEKKPDIRDSVNLSKMRLEDALKMYPQLGEQAVTSSSITIKNYPEAVRPSIKNWLTDYTAMLGYDYHDTMTRSNYIYRNVNHKNFASGDDQKLSHILTAFDERTPLEINTRTKQVAFPDFSDRPAAHRVADMRTGAHPSNPAATISRPPVPKIDARDDKNNKIKNFFNAPSAVEKKLPRPEYDSYSPGKSGTDFSSGFGLSSAQTFVPQKSEHTHHPAPENFQTRVSDNKTVTETPKIRPNFGQSQPESLFKGNVFRQEQKQYSRYNDSPDSRNNFGPKLIIKKIEQKPAYQPTPASQPRPAPTSSPPNQPLSPRPEEKKKSQPYHISSVFGPEDENAASTYFKQPLPKNVVNLRE